MKYFTFLLGFNAIVGYTTAFSIITSPNRQHARFYSSVPSDAVTSDLTLDELKADLVRVCTRSTKVSPSLYFHDGLFSECMLTIFTRSVQPLQDEVNSLVKDLEDKAEQVSDIYLSTG